MLLGLCIAFAGGYLSQLLTSSQQIQADKPSVPLVSEIQVTDEPIQPILVDAALDKDKVVLGLQLFQDPRLSRDNTVSCMSCHDLKLGGADQLPHSLGINGSLGDVNAPTVFNSAFNFKQFWNGRAETLEDQIDGPVHNPKEMGLNWPRITKKLERDQGYVTTFAALYPDQIQPHFKSYGCIACHHGVNVGGNMFQTFGVMGDYFANRGSLTEADLGRFSLTGKKEDRYVFKVPSLRNVALTAPYFHDGSAKTLPDAVEVMAKYQLGRSIPPEDVSLLVKFLRTLTGECDG